MQGCAAIYDAICRTPVGAVLVAARGRRRATPLQWIYDILFRPGRMGGGRSVAHAALGCVLLCCVRVASGTDAPAGRPALLDLPSQRVITASDNSVEVSAASASLGLRGPVLFFAGNFRRQLLRATQLEFGLIDHPISIQLGDRTNDLRVLGSYAPDVAGVERERIEIPDPAHGDLDQLRIALAQAFWREWRRALPVSSGAKPPQDPPAWLLTGLARHLGGEHRLEDLETVQEQWRRGRLPPLTELLAATPPVAMQHPSLQAVVAYWLLEHSGERLGVLLRRLGEGATWSPALVAESMQDRKSVNGLSEAWDAWQANVMREVRQVGVTTAGMVRAFDALLQIYPGDHGLTMPDAWRGRSFAECMSWTVTPEMQEALRAKANAIRGFAAGRDGSLQRVAAAYGAFLEAVAAGAPAERQKNLLEDAEAGRRQIEERTSKGAWLQEPVTSPVAEPALSRKR